MRRNIVLLYFGIILVCVSYDFASVFFIVRGIRCIYNRISGFLLN